jgi:hypothetical protein
MSVVGYRVIIVKERTKMKDKKTELVKMLAKYAQAGIPLTPAERNLIKYLLSKQ